MPITFPSGLIKPSNVEPLPETFTRPTFEELYGFDAVEVGLEACVLTATLDGNNVDVNLSCTTVTGAISYEFQRDDNSGFASPTTLQNTASTTFTDSPAPGSTYYYRVIATDGVDTSTSNTASVFVIGIFDTSLTFPTIDVFDNESDFITATYAPQYTIVHAKDTDKLYVWDGSNWVIYNNDPFTNTNSVDLGGTNEYIECGGNSDFSFTDGAGNDSAFSVSAWVKLDSNVRARIAAKGNMEWLFTTDSDSKFGLYLWSNDGTSAYLNHRETTALSTGVWHHLVATYDGSNTVGGINLYRAGSAVTMQNASAGTYAGMASQQGALRIGQWEVNSSVMNGLVDEVAIFDYELTASQVSSIYNSGTPADISSLTPLGWWRMGDDDSGTGTTVTDQGSGSNNGTLTNGPTFSTTVPS